MYISESCRLPPSGMRGIGRCLACSTPADVEHMWVIEKIETSGGFLPGLSVQIPQGLTCIIGARGSGKSTLAEAVRFALCGLSAAPKHCADLIQANLAGGALVTIKDLADGSNRYTVKRGLKQNPGLLIRFVGMAFRADCRQLNRTSWALSGIRPGADCEDDEHTQFQHRWQRLHMQINGLLLAQSSERVGECGLTRLGAVRISSLTIHTSRLRCSKLASV
jgi:hypothetical protein